jgi:hypothetical protein
MYIYIVYIYIYKQSKNIYSMVRHWSENKFRMHMEYSISAIIRRVKISW